MFRSIGGAALLQIAPVLQDQIISN